MKIFRWFVVLKNDPSGFYQPIAPARFLAGFKDIPDSPFMSPVWDGEVPALYKRKGASFIVSELRRVGYNVHVVPWLLLAIAERIKARKKNPWNER